MPVWSFVNLCQFDRFVNLFQIGRFVFCSVSTALASAVHTIEVVSQRYNIHAASAKFRDRVADLERDRLATPVLRLVAHKVLVVNLTVVVKLRDASRDFRKFKKSVCWLDAMQPIDPTLSPTIQVASAFAAICCFSPSLRTSCSCFP